MNEGDRPGVERRRVPALVALVLLAAVGIRARATAYLPVVVRQRPAGSTFSSVFTACLAVAGIALLLSLVVLVARRPRRKKEPEDYQQVESQVESCWERLVIQLVALTVAAIAIALPIVILFLAPSTKHARSAPPAGVPFGVPHAGTSSSGPAGGGSGGTVLLAAAALACLLIIAIAYLRRHRRTPGTGVSPADDEQARQVSRAVAAGERALREVADDRAAVIACYAAMEHALAQAGTARRAADTPTELLHRASTSGLVRGDAAARLTALFGEARFSEHPFEPGHRRDAQRALGELSHDLAVRS